MQLLKANVQRQREMREARTALEVEFRFYNFAGNPMMARLADGVVDVVFDLKGQAPHNVVPGAFVAMKAGAALWDIKEGRPISDASLVTYLVRPGGSPIKYVLAADQKMVEDMAWLLAEEAQEWDHKTDRRIATADRRLERSRPPQIQTPPPPAGH